jgi:hypothetical protein
VRQALMSYAFLSGESANEYPYAFAP